MHVTGFKLVECMPPFSKWYGSDLFNTSYLHLYKESCLAAAGVLLHPIGADLSLGDPGESPSRSLDTWFPFPLGRFLTRVPTPALFWARLRESVVRGWGCLALPLSQPRFIRPLFPRKRERSRLRGPFADLSHTLYTLQGPHYTENTS